MKKSRLALLLAVAALGAAVAVPFAPSAGATQINCHAIKNPKKRHRCLKRPDYTPPPVTVPGY